MSEGQISPKSNMAVTSSQYVSPPSPKPSPTLSEKKDLTIDVDAPQMSTGEIVGKDQVERSPRLSPIRA
jgi:hypothetical protein